MQRTNSVLNNVVLVLESCVLNTARKAYQMMWFPAVCLDTALKMH